MHYPNETFVLRDVRREGWGAEERERERKKIQADRGRQTDIHRSRGREETVEETRETRRTE